MARTEQDHTAGEKDSWLQYGKGLRSWFSILSGRAGTGEDEHTLEAALTGAVLVLMALNTGILLAVGVSWTAAVLAAALTAWAAVQNRNGISALRPGRRAGKGEDLVKVMSWNVLHDNAPAAVATGVADGEADLVILFEPVSGHLDALEEGVAAQYSIRCEVPGDGDERHAGIAGYGNQKVTSIEWRECAGMGALRAVVRTEGGEIAVWGFRPEAPTTTERKERWRSQLRALEALLREERLPVCLLGDMNSTVWHRPYTEVLEKLRLRRASVLRGTWRHPVLGWRARIDHVLIGPGLVRGESGRIGPFGSDHQALVVEIGRPGRKRVLAPSYHP